MNKSLFAKYYEERENIFTLEKEFGFATYKFGDDFVYIVDIYVLPELRQKRLASTLADEIVDEAVRAGKKKAIGTVDLEAKGSTESTKALLGYGFSIDSSDGKMIYFIKEI